MFSNNFTIPSALFISLVPTTGAVSVVLSSFFERKYQDEVVNDIYIDSEEQETNAKRIKALNEQKEFLRSIDDKKQQDTIDESDIIKVKMKDNKNN